jgi:hypothetical protein
MEGKERERGEKGKIEAGGEAQQSRCHQPVVIKNNQPMMVMIESKGMRRQQAIEQQVREARQEG